jgi:hypothetical protein
VTSPARFLVALGVRGVCVFDAAGRIDARGHARLCMSVLSFSKMLINRPGLERFADVARLFHFLTSIPLMQLQTARTLHQVNEKPCMDIAPMHSCGQEN